MASTTVKKSDLPYINPVRFPQWHNAIPYRIDDTYMYFYLNGVYAFPLEQGNVQLNHSGSIRVLSSAAGSGTITIDHVIQFPTGIEIACLKGSYSGGMGLAVLDGTLTFTRS